MRMRSKLAVTMAALAIGLAVGILDGTPAQAQSAFCPSSAGSPSGVSLQNGNCTNGTTGAFSGAALASQALSDLAQSTTQATTNKALDGISERRATEAAACEPGLVRIDGACQPPVAVTPAPRAAPAPVVEERRVVRSPQRVARKTPAKVRRAETTPLKVRRRGTATSKEVVEAPVPAPAAPQVPAVAFGGVPLPSGYHIGAWAHGFGDYERRTGTSTSGINCCSGAASTLSNGLPIPLFISARSTTETGGFVGGVDMTARSLFAGGDGLIVGLLAGYTSSDVKVRTTILSTNLPNLSNGFGNIKAKLSGPSAGLYMTYFDGGFSSDFLLKNDFLDLDETTNQLLAFTANVNLNPASLPFYSTGHTTLNQLTASENLNYKFLLSNAFWIEPTAGIQYTLSSYGGGATALGLKDGYLVRLQGGARLGVDTYLGQTRVTTTLTGLVYDDAVVHGDFIQGGAFGVTSNALKDQGKIRGDGILAVNFDLGNGVSTFVQGEVRGGQGLFGAGGKAGLRVQW
jgi:hypothetical protein